MRIPDYAINSLGDITVLDPAGVPVYAGAGAQPFEGCVVGALDAAGNTIANCPTVSVVPCLTGTGPLSPGQSYCTPPTTNIPVCPLNSVVSGSCVCPSGTSLDPTSLMCVGASGNSNTMMYAGLGVLFVLFVLPQLLAGGRR